ncbi:hypothetical protein [Hyphomonas sp.]|uniref:hypothetical protein n=1 Tax=Hyphomonas sp. TaxID=87 RepID=UPI0037C152CB
MSRLSGRRHTELPGKPPSPPDLSRDLLDKISKPPLPERVGRFAFAVRDRVCPGQPIEDKLSERLEAERDIALPDFKFVEALQQTFFQPQPDRRLEVFIERLFDDGVLCHAGPSGFGFEAGQKVGAQAQVETRLAHVQKSGSSSLSHRPRPAARRTARRWVAS